MSVSTAQYRPLDDILKQQQQQEEEKQRQLLEYESGNMTMYRSRSKLLNLKGTTARRKLLPLGLFVCLLLFYVMWCGLAATTTNQTKADLSYTGKSTTTTTTKYLKKIRESVQKTQTNNAYIMDGGVVDAILGKKQINKTKNQYQNQNNNTSIMTSTFINKHTLMTTTTSTTINATANNVPFFAANHAAVNAFGNNSPPPSTVGMSKPQRLPRE